MKNILYFLSLLYLSSCTESGIPTYNPFDASFDIASCTLKEDGCQLLWAPCGFETYGKWFEEGYYVLYQYNPHEEDYASAKFLHIILDSTLIVPQVDSNNTAENRYKKREEMIQRIIASAIDTTKLLSITTHFNLRLKEREHIRWIFEDEKHKEYSFTQDHSYEESPNGQSAILVRYMQCDVSDEREGKTSQTLEEKKNNWF